MDYDKTTIVGVTVCVILLLAWSPFMRYLGLVRPVQPQEQIKTEDSPPQENLPDQSPENQHDNGTPRPRDPSRQPDAPVTETARETAPDSDAELGRILEQGAGKTPHRQPGKSLELSCDEFASFEIDSENGGITEVRLRKYRADGQKDNVLLGSQQYPLCTTVWAEEDIELDNPVPDRSGNSRFQLERTIAGSDVTLSEAWEVAPETPYSFNYTLRIRNNGQTPFSVPDALVACGGLPSAFSARRASSRRGSPGGIDLFSADSERPEHFSIDEIRSMEADERNRLGRTPLQAIALHSKYFIFYLKKLGNPVPGCALNVAVSPTGEKDAPDWSYASTVLPGKNLQPGESFETRFTCYAGPKEFHRLRSVGGGLEKILSMDLFFGLHPRWMGWLSRQILGGLIGLNRMFNHRWGYGFAIIVLTFIVKMLFWPLTHRSMASMRKMQELQPEVKALREELKDDPEKMNKRIMALYKERNVSPLGGCLPMFMQIPVFFALFNTFRKAIELRHARFLWVVDLSLPDDVGMIMQLPIRPLALLMGASMLLQQKLAPTSSEPSQARMMTFMSLFFVFIFYTMPAGLTLYWTVNQILTIFQNLLSRRMQKKEE